MAAKPDAKGAAPAKADAKKEVKKIDGSVVHNKNFNLKEYIKAYNGITKVYRLMYIADHCPEQSLEAYRQAISELKKGINTNYYTECVAKAREVFGDQLGDEWGLDQKWVNTQNRNFTEKLTRLEANLSAARREGDKDPIRKAYEELAAHYIQRGDFTSALTKYLDSKDASHDTLDTCLSIIKASILLGSMSDVQNQASRAKNIHGGALVASPVKLAIVNAATGLQFLRASSYRLAAQSFLSCTIDIDNPNAAVGSTQSFSDIMSPKDIAVYGAITALVTFSRHDLKEQVLNNQRFKGFLELVPVWRKIITDFQSSKYKECFQALDKVRGDLMLDLYLAPHVHKLISKIYDRALTQYFRPFTSVKLASMAAAFSMEVPQLQNQLAYLIADNKIQARIDSHSKVLIARHADARSATYEQALALGNKYVRDCKSMLMRLSLVENDFVVKHPEARRKKDEDDGKSGGNIGK